MTRPSVETIAGRIFDFIADELGVPPDEVDSETNLGAYGLTSVAAVKLVGILEDAFALRLSPILVFEHPTVDALSHAIVESA